MSSGEQPTNPVPENEDAFDPGLRQLRDQVKKIMIPLLIKIFELKLAAQQAKTPPSRLHKQIGEPPEKIRKQLDHLDNHLKQLQLWCHSCQSQISKALNEMDETAEKPMRHTTSSEVGCHPAVEKSFSNAISSKAVPNRNVNPIATPKSKRGWLSKWFLRQQQ
jgi:hypothetical protein